MLPIAWGKGPELKYPAKAIVAQRPINCVVHRNSRTQGTSPGNSPVFGPHWRGTGRGEAAGFARQRGGRLLV